MSSTEGAGRNDRAGKKERICWCKSDKKEGNLKEVLKEKKVFGLQEMENINPGTRREGGWQGKYE